MHPDEEGEDDSLTLNDSPPADSKKVNGNINTIQRFEGVILKPALVL